MDFFVSQLAALCRAQVTRCKWVFVPAHAIGRTLGERIALDGTNWLNLRFVTPLDVALRMAAPFLVERGIEPSEEGLGPALIMRLLLDRPRDGGYFRDLADQPTLAQALWSTIRELRMAGVKARDLQPGAFESPAKHAELRALLRSYEQFLETSRRGDMAVVYEEALKHPDWCPIQAEDCWTELPHVAWSPLQRRVIDAMPGEHMPPRVCAVPGIDIPRRFASRSLEPMTPDAAVSPLAFLMSPGSAAAADRAALFHAGGNEAEIEEVFRRILASGAPLDRIEIACASDAHVALVWEKALRHDWPVTLGPGIPAAFTRPGRAIVGLCDWIETDFSASHFRRLLESGDMGVEVEDAGFSAGQAARILARAEAGWGRATYGLALGRLHKQFESRAADRDASDDDRAYAADRMQLTARVRAWITGLVQSVPEPDAAGTVPLQSVVDIALQYVEHTTARHSALDHRAAASLLEYVGELRALGAFSCSLHEALRFIRERVLSLQVAPERPRPGHLFASRLTQAGYAGRPHVYVVGLEEGRVFPSATEDPVLLDAERIAISPDLRTSTDRIDEAVFGVLSRLAACGTSAAPTTFSYSTRDTREFRETYASWLMLQAFRLQQGDAARSYQEMRTALGEPKSIVVPDRDGALSVGGWWLGSVVGTADAGVGLVTSTFAPIARGRVALAKRAGAAFTEYDGHVPEAGPVLDPCASETGLSVTELQDSAGCPFRFFLKRGLGVRPLDDRERDRDVWLDPLTRGFELHELYAALLRRCRAEHRRPDRRKDGPWLEAKAGTRLQELDREMPPASREIFDRESKEFIADVALFVEAESENTASTPIGFEVSFGRPLEDDLEPLARPEAVEITLGAGLTFRVAGRIDRIDEVRPGAFEIVDYKTGGFYRPKWSGVFDGGRRLQHALYGLAAAELLRDRHRNPKVVAGVYYFPTRKGRRERVRIETPSRTAIAAVLGDLRELIRTGAFAHAASKEDCRFCDYSTACSQTLEGRCEAKLQDATLHVYTRLAGHE